MTRADALQLMQDYTTKPGLRQHMLAVEAAMRHLAAHYGEDVERWGLAGLLHDFDYERYPTLPDHPLEGAKILSERGVDEEIVTAILGHADLPEYPRTTRMAKALFAVDELAGFIVAVTYVRPSKAVADVQVSSVTKKLKDKAFAAAVSREDIAKGATELEMEQAELITHVLTALQEHADTLGLRGTSA